MSNAQNTARLGNQALGSNVTAAATITPTGLIFPVSGSGAITTINLPYTGFLGQITVLPAAGSTWTTATGGNIALGSTAVVAKALHLTWSGTAWYPSY